MFPEINTFAISVTVRHGILSDLERSSTEHDNSPFRPPRNFYISWKPISFLLHSQSLIWFVIKVVGQIMFSI